jgi:hypothetical protein
MKENEMNLYILNNVLSDYTDGMAVIAAPSLERCRELFVAEFGKYQAEDFDNFGKVKIIENVPHVEGVVSYVYGGG